MKRKMNAHIGWLCSYAKDGNMGRGRKNPNILWNNLSKNPFLNHLDG